MIRTMPLRRITLHLLHLGLTEALTFMFSTYLKRYVTLQVETGWSINKTWFHDRWEQVVKFVKEELGYEVLQFGYNAPPVEGAKCLEGKRHSIRELLGILQRADGHIGLDSVFNHAANGYDIPAVILFGSTAPSSSGYSNAINIHHGRKASGGTGEWMCSPC